SRNSYRLFICKVYQTFGLHDTLKTHPRKIEDLPTIDFVEGKLNVINEKIQRIEERINLSPSKSEVELLVSNKHKENVRWQCGIGVAICGVIIGAMKYIFS
ncbi:hypothetical protein ABNC64_17160, partial [Paenibacillus larvae]